MSCVKFPASRYPEKKAAQAFGVCRELRRENGDATRGLWAKLCSTTVKGPLESSMRVVIGHNIQERGKYDRLLAGSRFRHVSIFQVPLLESWHAEPSQVPAGPLHLSLVQSDPPSDLPAIRLALPRAA